MQVLNVIWVFAILTTSTSAFAERSYGVFMVVKGDVKIARADGSSQPAKVSAKVFPGDTVKTAADSRAKITMSDRNNIHVSPESEVKIADYKEGQAKNVELQLNEGKVRNEVNNKYDGEKNKFIIKTPSAVAGVRGTDFLVNFSSKTQVTEVVTFKGSVSFSAFKGSQMGDAVLINRQQSATTTGETAPVPQPIPQADFKRVDMDTMVKNFGQGTSTAPTPGANMPPPKEPLKDSADKTPDTFGKIPDAMANQPPRPPQPVKNIMPAQPNTRVNDAIRNKTDKTKVIIQPTTGATPQTTPNPTGRSKD